MVLLLDHPNNNTSTFPSSSTMTVKSLDQQPEGESSSPKRLSLLVDYSKRKASLNNSTAAKKELFGDLEVRCKSPVETIENALALSSLHSRDWDAEGSSLNESFNLDDVRPVSFRVRKTSIRRSKSMDERKISSYDHLQNSIRSLLKQQEDEEEQATSEEPTTSVADRRATIPTPAAPVDRRAQLANARRKHQSMRNLTTTAACQSMRNLSAASPPHIPRRTKNKDALSKSLHTASTSCSSDKDSARTNLLVKSTKCRSCRHLMRRSKSLQESTSNLNNSISCLLTGGSLHGSTEHSSKTTTTTRVSPRRSSTAGSYKRGSLALMKAQTMSRRNLLANAMDQDESSSFNAMNDSTIFFTGSRIRRLDTN